MWGYITSTCLAAAAVVVLFKYLDFVEDPILMSLGQINHQQQPPLCPIGDSDGHYNEVNGTEEWIGPGGCRYDQACTSCEHKKLVFIGDSTMRHLFETWIDMNFGDKLSIDRNRTRVFKVGDHIYSFRGRLWRKSKDSGVDHTNELIRSISKDENTVLVLSVGPHEVIGWTNRPRPHMNMSKTRADAHSFLSFMCEIGFRGQIIWWGPYEIFEGKIRGAPFRRSKSFLNKLRSYLNEQMAKLGAVTLDFRKLSDRSQNVDVSGVHYPTGPIRSTAATILNHNIQHMKRDDGRVLCFEN